ncbi:MAG: FG-GAP repeat domain-containing protein [Candidatus Sulfotelmatobacter sp.]
MLTDSHDFNDDGKSDILLSTTSVSSAAKESAAQAASTTLALWLMNGSQVPASGLLASVPTNWAIIGQRDFSGHGDADLLWRDTSGNLAIWFMHRLQILSTASLGNVPNNWNVFGTGDLNRDGVGDLLWRDSSSGTVAVWFMGPNGVLSTAILAAVSNSWSIVGGDNKGSIFWRDTAGNIALWHMNGAQITGSVVVANVANNWVIAGISDFNSDGNTDLLFRDTNSGTVAIWFLNKSGGIQSSANIGAVSSATTWRIAQTGDYNGDGYSDLLWLDGGGNVAIWFMRGASIVSTANLGNVGTSWTVQSANAE